MTTLILAGSRSNDSLRQIFVSAVLGVVLLFVAGFSQPDSLHAATHDTRHATGFPCH
jgi:cobalt transporter subunit CbtB